MTYDIAIDGLICRVPSRWKTLPFRRLASLADATNVKHSAPLLSLASTGVIAPREDFGGLGRQMPADETIGRYWMAGPGDLIVNPMWLVGGGIGVSEISGAVSPDYRVYHLNSDLHPRYVHHLLRSQPYRDQYKLYTRAETTFDRRVSKVDFHAMPILFPPLDEQRRIADFLDAETARIDQLAKLRTSQAEALGSRYQSQLSNTAQALSARHGTVKVRHVLQKIEQGWSPQCEDRPANDGEWGVVKAGCVNSGTFDSAQHKTLPAGTAPELRYRLRAGDLLMSRASGSVDLIGSIAVLPDNLHHQLLLCDKVYRLRMDRTRMSPHFVAFMLRTLQVREQIKLGISGAEGMANNLPTATVTNLPLPDVPLNDQGDIVNDLSDAWSAVQETRQKLREQLSVLTERRQALITAAVSGGVAV
jgi:type I restriction enzyme S subunit